MSVLSDNLIPFLIAGAVGFVVYKLVFVNESGNNNNNNNNELQNGATTTSANVTATQRPQQQQNNNTNTNTNVKPSKTDDLASLISSGKSKFWKKVLHTRTNFEKIPTSVLRNATKNNPNLLVVHQLFTDANEKEDVSIIKQNVDLEYFPRDRLILCTTDKGPEAVARQEETELFISDNRELCDFLSQFLTFVVFVKGGGDENNKTISIETSKNGKNRIHVVSNVAAVL